MHWNLHGRRASSTGDRCRRGTVVLGVWLASVFAPSLVADVVYLKNKGKLEGEVHPGPRDGTIELRQGDGTIIVLERDRIDRIEKSTSPLRRFRKRLEKVPPGELEPLEKLLVWARDQRLSQAVREVARRILKVDRHHAGAREELGYIVFENRWVLRSELRKRKGLVRFRGEWVTPAERLRREREDSQRELEIDLEALTSSNQYVRDLALRKIRKRLATGGAESRAIAGKHLRHPEPQVRKVAAAFLARFPATPKELRDDREAQRRLAAELHEVALAEQDPTVLKMAHAAVARFFPDESFRLALDTATRSPNASQRQRAADAAYFSLKKAFVPTLCRAIQGDDGQRHRELQSVLVRLFKHYQVDHGYDREKWLKFWEEKRDRFTDET